MEDIKIKYIDAEKLRKLLANRYEEITVPVLTDEGGLESFYRRSEIHNILKIVDSLQYEQQEVNLERDAVQFCFDKGLNVTPYQAKTIARHFYELGRNSKSYGQDRKDTPENQRTQGVVRGPQLLP